MKSITILLSTVVFLLTLGSCDCTSLKGEGDYVMESRKVSGFTGVSLGLHARIVLEQDSAFDLKIEAQENVLEVIKTEVRGKMLHISGDNICFWDTEPVTIFLSMPEIDDLEIGGSGVIITKREISGHDLDLDINGSGQMMLEVSMDEIDADISGSGEIDIAGTTDELDVDISGSGEFYAYNLMAGKADVDISGSGNCKVFVTDKLDAGISGSGEVYYKGTPRIKTNISGSGQVKKID